MKYLTSLLPALLMAMPFFAADLIVDPLATPAPGVYNTINTAIAAAAPGDRILVVTGNGPLIETINITKSIEIVPAEPGSRWKLQGWVHINGTPSALAGGSTIRISGMHQLSGSVSVPYSLPAGGVAFSMADCKVDNGSVNLDANYLRSELLQDSVMNGVIHVSSGIVAGCHVHSTSFGVQLIHLPTRLLQPGSDPISYVVGNSIHAAGNSQLGIYHLSTNTSPVIANNVMYRTGASTFGVYVNSTPSTGVTEINNNTIHSINSQGDAIFINGSSSIVRVFSNYFRSVQGNPVNAVNVAGGVAGLLTASYNHAEGPANVISVNVINDGTNVSHAVGTNTFDLITGALQGPAVDGGHPNPAYRDLDDTRNDPGAAGGSYTRENFIGTNGPAVTGFVIAPTRVQSGETIDIKAFGFAR